MDQGFRRVSVMRPLSAFMCLVFVLVVSFGGGGTAAFADTVSKSVTVTVVGSVGAPESGTRVTLSAIVSSSVTTSASAVTDENGQVTLSVDVDSEATTTFKINVGSQEYGDISLTGNSATYKLHSDTKRFVFTDAEKNAITQGALTYTGEAQSITFSSIPDGATVKYKSTTDGSTSEPEGVFSETAPTVTTVASAVALNVWLQLEKAEYDEYVTSFFGIKMNKGDPAPYFDDDAPDTIIYGDDVEEDFSEYLVTPEGVDFDVTYSIEGDNSAIVGVGASDGHVTLTGEGGKVGDVALKAELDETDNYTSGVTTHNFEVEYVDTPDEPYTINGPGRYESDDMQYYSGTVTVMPAAGYLISTSNALNQPDSDTGWRSSLTFDSGIIQGLTIALRKTDNKTITDMIRVNETIVIDKDDPWINTFAFSKQEPTLRLLPSGTFANGAVLVIVSGIDNATGSGLTDIKLYKYTKEGDLLGEVDQNTFDEQSDEHSGVATFMIEPDFEGVLRAKAYDHATNESELTAPNTSNSNICDDDGYTMLETMVPAVSDITDRALNDDSVRNAVDVNDDGAAETVYRGDALFTFTAQDMGSGLFAVDVTVNGDPYMGEITINDEPPASYKPVTFAELTTARHAYAIDTTRLTPDADGKLHVVVRVEDNAGNVSSKSSIIYIDNTSATITGFDFVPKDNIDEKANGVTKLYDAVESTDYGFYFKQDVDVTIVAEDIANANEAASGVESITYRMTGPDGGEVAGQTVQGGRITFTVRENFKGKISAYATDNVNNRPSNSRMPASYSGASVDTDGFVHPKWIVREDGAKHAESSNIDIAPPESAGAQTNTYKYSYSGRGQADRSLDYDTSRPVPLYGSNPTFKLTVEDTYSGIREVKWTVFEKGESAVVRSVAVSDGGVLSGDSRGWSVGARDGNLVTKLANASVGVSGNSNNMVLLVELMDRAGNISYDYYVSGVDKTAPEISMRYDNNAVDSNRYFKANRTATIVVTERNFSADNAVITGDNPAAGKKLKWQSKSGDATNGDEDTYTATVSYTKDGDYTFGVKYTDFAGNNNREADYGESAAPRAFTIDKTTPTVRVSYDNNNAANGNYYAESRTATVTVTEHNFDPGRVDILGTATDNDANVAFPGNSGWSRSGDDYSSTIPYSSDALYTFDIEVTDRAGNVAGDYAPDEFYVDRTLPEVDVSNVEDGSANRDEISPVVTFSDTNYDPDSVEITLTGVKPEHRDGVTPDGSFAEIDNGQTFSFNDFDRSQDADDLYTLTTTITDRAGNQREDAVTFSVNRHGSIYYFDESMETLRNNSFVKEGQDVVFHEINVDSLNEESIDIRVSQNGSARSLSAAEGDFSYRLAGHPSAPTEWKAYEYTVPKTYFGSDGRYEVAVYSEDMAGNVNENIADQKEAEIKFVVDKTAPVIMVADLADGDRYDTDEKKVTASIKDNLILDDSSIAVTLNGEPVDFEKSGESYSYVIPSANSLQKVQITALDMAGNKAEFSAGDFLVTTNVFIRWFYNTPLFIGSIAGVAALVALSVFLIRRRMGIKGLVTHTDA